MADSSSTSKHDEVVYDQGIFKRLNTKQNQTTQTQFAGHPAVPGIDPMFEFTGYGAKSRYCDEKQPAHTGTAN